MSFIYKKPLSTAPELILIFIVVWFFLKASEDEGLVARGTNFQPHSFQSPVKGEGLKVVLITNRGYRMKPP